MSERPFELQSKNNKAVGRRQMWGYSSKYTNYWHVPRQIYWQSSNQPWLLCFVFLCVITMLPAPPLCRAESTEPGCMPVADDVVPCADTHSQRQECIPPQCVQTNCGKIKHNRPFIHQRGHVRITGSALRFWSNCLLYIELKCSPKCDRSWCHCLTQSVFW